MKIPQFHNMQEKMEYIREHMPSGPGGPALRDGQHFMRLNNGLEVALGPMKREINAEEVEEVFEEAE